MGRTPAPTATAEMTGATKKNPQRYRDRDKEPQAPVGLQDPPDYLSDEDVAIWHELEGQIALGVLTHSDSMAFEVLVSMVSEFRDDPRRMSATRVMNLISLLARFGMTPSDRTRIKVVPSGSSEGNPFAQFKNDALARN